MTDKYRVDPDFAVPEPTAANFFSYFPLPETPEEFDRERTRAFDLMRENGAQQGRITIVSDEHPVPPYPNGVWLEGWSDPKARQLPFGEAEKPGGAIYPPLVADTGKLRSDGNAAA